MTPVEGLLASNPYRLLAGSTTAKRKKMERRRLDLQVAAQDEDEVFLTIKSTTTGKDLSNCNPFLLQKVFDNALGEKPLDARKLRDGTMLVKANTPGRSVE